MSRIQHIFLIEIFWCTKHESQDIQMHQKTAWHLFIYFWGDINYLNFCLVILWISGFVINIVSYSSLLLLLFSSKFETFKRHQSQLAPLQIFHEFIISFVARDYDLRGIAAEPLKMSLVVFWFLHVIGALV